MKHRHDRQHLVTGPDPDTVCGAGRHRVQKARTMAVYNAFGIAGSTAGVTHCGRGVLIDLRPPEVGGFGVN